MRMMSAVRVAALFRLLCLQLLTVDFIRALLVFIEQSHCHGADQVADNSQQSDGWTGYNVKCNRVK